ncbi:hypothetical protein ACTXT7_010447 [Hymenolepis weldensis]
MNHAKVSFFQKLEDSGAKIKINNSVSKATLRVRPNFCPRDYQDTNAFPKSKNQELRWITDVFKCSPSNDIRKYLPNPPPTQGRQPRGAKFAAMLRKVRGHLCEYPQEYLADEELTVPPFTKERLASEDIWI